ncbi:hypothetical protein AB0F81_15770 [Actinoplanes sp. NPDC024001]|uniref:hypothetical protein n=1 Tax=Actinoplanes sp. NPDC024001 TaxID=3154598 RepID=UPI00340F5E5B
MASASYPRAVGMAALQAALTSTWIAAGELSPVRRRLARTGLVAAVGAVSYAASDRSGGTSADEIVVGKRPVLVSEGGPVVDEEPFTFDKRKAAMGAAVVTLSLGAMVGRRQLEKRWLARLIRNGHPHPTRGLAVRVGAVEFAAQLAFQLADMRRAGGKTSRQG